MKILFFLIVLCNVGFFMWELRNGAFAPVMHAPLVSKEPLLLVTEVKTPPREDIADKELPVIQQNPVAEQMIAEKASETTPVAQSLATQDAADTKTELSEPAAVVVSPTPIAETVSSSSGAPGEITPLTDKAGCYEAGPFEDMLVYDAWRSRFAENEKGIESFDREDQVISSYMVYYPAEKGQEQAEGVLKMLRDKGIDDVLLQRVGKDQGEISLGIFNAEERASVLKNELKAKGVDAQIKPRYKLKTRKYVHAVANDLILESLKNLQNGHPEFTIKPLETCPKANP